MPIQTLRRMALLSLLAATAVAEDTIDEITVTADFRGRAADDLPVSVTVLDADFIDETAVQHIEELVNFVPNLNWSGDGHRARYFQIRGVGELEQYQGAPNPSVGFLIDDIDFSGIGTVATLFDVESIDVLRGPQGSRYGANALGGLIYVNSTEPGDDRDSRIEATVGSDDTRALGVAIGGDIDGLGYRLSAHRHESNGFRDNPFLGRDDTNAREETSLRLGLKTALHDSLEARLSMLYSSIDNGYDAFAIDNSYTMLSDKPGRDAQDSLGASLRFDWYDDAGGSLTSITAVADSDVDFSFDADWGNAESWAPVTYDYVSFNDRTRETISQEFRYARGDWLVGAYALKLRDGLVTVNQGEYFDPGFDFADSLDERVVSDYASTSVALFAELDRPVTARTRLVAGLRVERRDSDYSDSDGLVIGPSETMWGGELALNHELSGDAMVFASLSRGYKAGGFNLGLVPDELRGFSDEALWTFESGIKADIGAFRLNATAFHAWRVDQQVRASFQLDPNNPASFGFATINVDGGRNYGVEAEASWVGDTGLEAYASVGLLYGGFPDDVEVLPGIRGREQAHAPNYTVAAGVAWRHDSGFFLRLDAQARDAFYFDVSHNQRSEAYALLNARTGYTLSDWRIELWARNLTDRYYAVRGFFFGNEPPDFPPTLYTRAGDPRQVGLTLKRSF